MTTLPFEGNKGGNQIVTLPASPSGLAITSIVNPQGLSITGIERLVPDETATVTTAAPHNLQTGEQVTISGAVETEYNGTFTITVIAADEFTYTVVGEPSTPATGVIVYGQEFVGVVERAAHGLVVGETVVIVGAIPATYNGTFVIIVVESSSKFKIRIPLATETPAGTPGTYSVASSARVDVGTRNRSVRLINSGSEICYVRTSEGESAALNDPLGSDLPLLAGETIIIHKEQESNIVAVVLDLVSTGTEVHIQPGNHGV